MRSASKPDARTARHSRASVSAIKNSTLMNIITYIQQLVVSLLASLGLSQGATVALANVSLVAIAMGIVIAVPGPVLFAVVILLGFLFLNR